MKKIALIWPTKSYMRFLETIKNEHDFFDFLEKEYWKFDLIHIWNLKDSKEFWKLKFDSVILLNWYNEIKSRYEICANIERWMSYQSDLIKKSYLKDRKIWEYWRINAQWHKYSNVWDMRISELKPIQWLIIWEKIDKDWKKYIVKTDYFWTHETKEIFETEKDYLDCLAYKIYHQIGSITLLDIVMKKFKSLFW